MTNANIENELGLMKCLFCDNQFVLTRGKTLPRCNKRKCRNKYMQLERHFKIKFKERYKIKEI